MRLLRLTSLGITALILAGCSSGPVASSDTTKVAASEATKPTVESLISLGCDKYLGLDSKGAQADFVALSKLDSNFEDVVKANQDILITLKGVKTIAAIDALDAKSKQRVYKSILILENLCAGVDAP